MKNLLKKNQIMITALAIMIAVAGYLNFAGSKLGEEELADVSGQAAMLEEEAEMAAAKEGDLDTVAMLEEYDPSLDISDEDIEAAALTDIESLDSEDLTASADYLDEGMAEAMSEDVDGVETPGEAVFTSSANVTSLSGAKLLKEQTRAKNKETLLEIINNTNITEAQKQTAVEGMIALTDIAEKETSAEILLEAKGFADVVVSIANDGVDVVVNAPTLTDAQRAQIEDIVKRKTGVAAENIIISPVN